MSNFVNLFELIGVANNYYFITFNIAAHYLIFV